jgi:predicted transcriptional regulator
MANNAKSVQVGVRLKRETHEALAKLAHKQERTVTWLVTKFVEQGLRREAQVSKLRKTP